MNSGAVAPGAELTALQVQWAAAGAWPPIEVERLGEWVLRAGLGFTNRANSVIPLGDPDLPLSAALEAVEQWYAARSLPAVFVVAGRVGFDPSADAVAAEAIRRGYAASDPTLFLTASTGLVASSGGAAAEPVGGAVMLELSAELSEEWLTAYGSYRENDRAAARAILTGSPAQVFVTARAAGQIVGIGRLGVSAGWGGIAAMWVDPAYRRRGLAGEMLASLARFAAEAGVPRLHLQVWAHNAPALALYRRAGFIPHHAYVMFTQDVSETAKRR